MSRACALVVLMSSLLILSWSAQPGSAQSCVNFNPGDYTDGCTYFNDDLCNSDNEDVCRREWCAMCPGTTGVAGAVEACDWVEWVCNSVNWYCGPASDSCG